MSKSSLPAFIKKKKKGEEEKNTMKRSEMWSSDQMWSSYMNNKAV